MAVNVKDLDQVNDIIEITSSRGGTAFLEGKYIHLPNNLLSVIYQCAAKGGIGSLFNGDLPCRVMRVDQPKWQKGRLKLTLEFIPDDSPQEETPQDELSSIRNQNIS